MKTVTIKLDDLTDLAEALVEAKRARAATDAAFAVLRHKLHRVEEILLAIKPENKK